MKEIKARGRGDGCGAVKAPQATVYRGTHRGHTEQGMRPFFLVEAAGLARSGPVSWHENDAGRRPHRHEVERDEIRGRGMSALSVRSWHRVGTWSIPNPILLGIEESQQDHGSFRTVVEHTREHRLTHTHWAGPCMVVKGLERPAKLGACLLCSIPLQPCSRLWTSASTATS